MKRLFKNIIGKGKHASNSPFPRMFLENILGKGELLACFPKVDFFIVLSHIFRLQMLLILSQMTNFRLLQSQRVCRPQFQI